ncbi:MAG: zinc-binding alcohol dehydrogenase [Chloroflexi bacterium]|nr:zinc-binding alcohol dehydrogenase [Chloroflexota bacterium]
MIAGLTGETMRIRQAIVRRENHVELETAELPDRPGPGEVLIETETTFISAGTELANYTGIDPTVRTPGAWNEYPKVPGYANVGRILASADDHEGFSEGTRVFTMGPHASHHVQPTTGRRGLVVEVPDGIDYSEAAAARMACVAITALQTSSVQVHDRVAVFGLGVVGNLAAQFFQLAGARVIGIDPMAARRDLAVHVGIENVIPGGDDVASQIRELAGTDLPLITVDAVGHSAVVEQAASVTAQFGEVILLGTPRASYESDLTTAMRDIHNKWIDFKSALEWKIPMHPATGMRNSTVGNLVSIFEMVESGKINVRDLISHRLPAEQIKHAYESLLNDKESYWGVCLDWMS